MGPTVLDGNVRPYQRGPVRIAVDLMISTVFVVGLGALVWYRRDAVLGITAGSVLLVAGAGAAMLRRLSGRLARVLRVACAPVLWAAVTWPAQLAVQTRMSPVTEAVEPLVVAVLASVFVAIQAKRWPQTHRTQREKQQAGLAASTAAQFSSRIG
jgi:drug/metabolite transporter (DMT)-like permease